MVYSGPAAMPQASSARVSLVVVAEDVLGAPALDIDVEIPIVCSFVLPMSVDVMQGRNHLGRTAERSRTRHRRRYCGSACTTRSVLPTTSPQSLRSRPSAP